MKKIQMRVTALIAALMIFVSSVCVSASAESVSELKKEYISNIISITYSMMKGEITPSQAAIAVSYLREEYKNDVSSAYYQIADSLYNTLIGIGDDVGNISADVIGDLFDILKQLGIDVGDFWGDYADDNGLQSSNTDGYGAVLVTRSTGCDWSTWYYGDYGVILDNGRYYIKYYRKITLQDDGTITDTYEPDPYGTITVSSYERLIGDWRFEDGTQSEEAEEPTTSVPNLEEQDEETLLEFLKDLLEKLSLEFPDLSTVEGLLRAILNQCIQINGKMDEQGGSVNSAELQLMLEMSIASLMANNDTNTCDLLNELIGIREDMAKYFGTDSIVDTDDEDITDEDINDDNFLQSIIDKLTGCISLFHVSLFDLPSLDDVRDLGDDGIQLLLKTVDLFVSVAEVLPLLYITNTLQIMEGMMFDKSTPADLTFTVDCFGESVHFTLLSASLLNQNGFQDAILIVRTLTGFLMIYIWLKWCRKYIISIVG